MVLKKVSVEGTVQGVGFRPFVYRESVKRNLKGSVKNTGGEVEIILQGEKEKVKEFLRVLEEENPQLANVENVEVSDLEGKNFEDFSIIRSDTSSKDIVFPPDISICESCVEELFDKDDRREGFFMNSCTDCGPRFSVLHDLPYDRPETSFREFPMCDDCSEEYENPMNRRYYAQTTSCPNCGPELELLSSLGEKIPTDNLIEEVCERLEKGQIIGIKGTGGFHIACRAESDEVVKKLRQRFERPSKPFAVMAENLKEVKKFSEVSEEEEKLLKSPKKPIVLVREKDECFLSDHINPGLGFVGVMLPYTGLGNLVLDKVDFPIVMTSANMPSIPMYTENERAVESLGEVVDCFLVHDLEIVNRVDDSVIKRTAVNSFIRRSRGWVPESVDTGLERDIMAVGEDMDNVFAVNKDGEAYLSQHIGDLDNLETIEHFKDSFDFLRELTDADIRDVVSGTNPGFNSLRIADEISHKQDASREKVQHHFAHIGSVMMEKNLKECLGIAIDGFGLGLDGTAWGGEVMLVRKGSYRRIGSIQSFELPGIDKAARRPGRTALSILDDMLDRKELKEVFDTERLERGDETFDTILRQKKAGTNTISCSSAGRVLDAASFILGACEQRYYEGEPAMKLESLALEGDVETRIPVNTIKEDGRKVLKLENGFRALLEEDAKKEDLAASFQDWLARGMAEIAIEQAERFGPRDVCVSGGVCYNRQIIRTIKEEVEKEGLNFYTNELVPPGDGGIPLGQLFALSSKN